MARSSAVVHQSMAESGSLDPALSMLQLLWKIPLIATLVLLATTTALVTRARLSSNAVRNAPNVSLGADGLARVKRAVFQAVATADLRRALDAFVAGEGRRPVDLDELANSEYFEDTVSGGRPDLHRYRYDASTGSIICTSP